MEKMPDEIYAWMGIQDNGSWDREPCVCDSHESVKYIRADLADLSPQTVPAAQHWVTVRNDGARHIVVEVDDVEVIRDFYVSGETQLNHSYNMTDMISAAPEPPTEKLPHIEGLSEAIDHCEAIEKELREGNQYPKSFVMQIPARPYADSDFMFYRLFKAAREYLKRMEGE